MERAGGVEQRGKDSNEQEPKDYYEEEKRRRLMNLGHLLLFDLPSQL
jgi:hypothetical protein